jgi:hypothetical protein
MATMLIKEIDELYTYDGHLAVVKGIELRSPDVIMGDVIGKNGNHTEVRWNEDGTARNNSHECNLSKESLDEVSDVIAIAKKLQKLLGV